MEKEISYLNRNYSDYRDALIEFSKKYYPDLALNFDDASVGSWIIDIAAEIADNLSYHIDRTFQETNINSANETSSLYNIARNLGVKIPGPKGAMAEVKFTCTLPLGDADKGGVKEPNWDYSPIIKRGTKVTSGVQSFEVLEDINFAEQFDNDGNSNRTIIPIKNSNGQIIKYKITKLAVVTAGDTKIYSKTLSSSDIGPFMEVIIPIENVMNIESVVVKDGTNLQTYPSFSEFSMINETSSNTGKTGITRFFEVDALAQQYRWGEVEKGDKAVRYEYEYSDGGETIPTYSVCKGEWKPVRHKFITEYTDKGYIKLIFGAGLEANDETDLSAGASYSQYQIAKTIRNKNLGILPKANSTLYVLYRVGGGKSSNVAKGSITTISLLNVDMPNACDGNSSAIAAVRQSIEVTNTTPSVSGKDMPTGEELKHYIKYYTAAQNRCVTVKDYITRTLMLPPKYGTPFRVGAAEENNKIMLYLLGLDCDGHLDALLPDVLAKNVQNYLAQYRMINDYVEIKSGRIINLSIEADLHIDKTYEKTDVIRNVINKIADYFDINNHLMGENIYTGDIEKEISKIDGVINLIDFRVYNETGSDYSSTQTSQEIVSSDECSSCDSEIQIADRYKLDLKASDGIIYSDGDTMLEIKYPETDIRIRAKVR